MSNSWHDAADQRATRQDFSTHLVRQEEIRRTWRTPRHYHLRVSERQARRRAVLHHSKCNGVADASCNKSPSTVVLTSILLTP